MSFNEAPRELAASSNSSLGTVGHNMIMQGKSAAVTYEDIMAPTNQDEQRTNLLAECSFGH